jgi:hypothetical protein
MPIIVLRVFVSMVARFFTEKEEGVSSRNFLGGWPLETLSSPVLPHAVFMKNLYSSLSLLFGINTL